MQDTRKPPSSLLSTGDGDAMRPVAKDGRRFEHLDGTRGIAAFIVVLSHISAGFFPATYFGGGTGLIRVIATTPLFVAISGTFSVVVFFVLSGFVLSGREQKPISTLPLRLVGRYLRLAIPAGAGIVIASLLLLAGLMYSNQAGAILNNSWLSLHYASGAPSALETLSEIAGRYFVTGTSLLDNPLWTMKQELIGSCIVFAVSTVLPRGRWRIVTYAVGIGVLLFRVPTGLPATILLFQFPFMAGAILREWPSAARPSGTIAWWPLVAIGLFLGGFPHVDYHATLYEPIGLLSDHVFGESIVMPRALGAICLVLGIIKLRPSFLTTPLCAFLGRVSFPLYVSHLPIICSLLAWSFVVLGAASLVIAIPLCIAICVALATILEKIVDQPAVALSHRLQRSRA